MRRTIALLVIGAALLTPGTALAQDAREGYGPGILGEIQSVEPPTRDGTSTGTNPQREGALPFTGADIGLVAGLGVVLLAAGFALRRVRVHQN